MPLGVARAAIIAAKGGAAAAGQILAATFWLRAQDANLTLDGSNGVSAAANQGSAGSAMDLAQGTAGNRPIKVTNVVNGRAVLRFDGSNDFIDTPSVAGSAFLTANQNVVFMVLKQTGAVANNTPFSWRTGVSDTDRLACHATFGNTIYWDSGNATESDGRISVAQPAGWDDAFHILELVRNGATATILVDGTQLDTDATMTVGITTTASRVFRLGAMNDGSVAFGGDLAEIIVASGATPVASATRDAARAALASYYGITLP